jgi:hypothetical protein
MDPNDLIGPGGYGDAHFLKPGLTMPYTIRFENQADTEGAPAQVVIITEQLDANLDWNTFQLGEFGFGGQTFDVPAGLTYSSTRLDLTRTDGVYLDVVADFDVATGLSTWTFTSLDPMTLDVPWDPLEGFLPPNNTPPEGEGFVSYTVQSRPALVTGDLINAQARITFDMNPPMDTPLFINTIDAGPPTSSVGPLPPPTFKPTFVVSWSGSDDPGSSGIASSDVYVSTDDGPFVAWLTGTTATSASFHGVPGHRYGFYSVATDNVGNQEAPPDGAQAVTLVGPIVVGPPQPLSPVSSVKGVPIPAFGPPSLLAGSDGINPEMAGTAAPTGGPAKVPAAADAPALAALGTAVQPPAPVPRPAESLLDSAALSRDTVTAFMPEELPTLVAVPREWTSPGP